MASRRAHSVLAVVGAAAVSALGAGLLARSSPQTGAIPAGPDEVANDLNQRLAVEVAPLLAKYCISCHSGDEPSGELPLDKLRSVKDAFGGEIDARRIKEMVGSSAMPPKDKLQPTDHERLILAQWAEDMAKYVPPDAPIDPGWFTIHRLNKAEYRNTLRDLLGIDPHAMDLAAKLPPDDTGYGFDNIADVLSTSPLAVEQYLDAAERAVDAALGPVVRVGDEPRVLRPLAGTAGQPLPSGGFFLYTNGPASANFTAPATGDYIIRIKAWETHAGDELARMSLHVGKKELKQFSVSGTQENPQDFEVRTRLTKGSHAMAVHFLNDFYVKDVADRNLGVESVSIAGPVDEASVERPGQWSKIFKSGAGIADESQRAKAVVGTFASRAYRKPASESQVAALLRVYAAERASGRGFESAVRTTLAASLVSPNFLFRSVANPQAANPASRYALDMYELASRLSYFLWSSMPDDKLMQVARDGSLAKEEVLAREIKRMIADTKANAFIENFAGQWLELRVLPAVAIDRQKYPRYDDAMRDAMTTEATLFFGNVLRGDRSVLEFIDSRETFLNAKLADYYGVPGVKGDDFRLVPLPDGSPRGGVLTMGAVLTLTSNTTRTSPVKRGLFVLDQILGAPPPPPPPDIPPLEQSAKSNPDATVRERLAAHVANATCAGCHNRLDPLGFAFEHFDAIGQWRDSESGKPVDATGTLPGGATLNGSADLKKILLARSDEFVECLTAKLLTYAIGRGMEPFDRPAVRKIAQRTRANGDRLSALVESVVLSETFRTCRGRKPAHE